METFIVDRIENTVAVLETVNRTFLQVPLSDFAEQVRERDVVFIGADGKYHTDTAKTEERKKRLFQLQKHIFSE